MPNIFNEDFRDFIKSLNEHQVNYLLVGGYAVILHGYRRTTGDLDIWVETTSENLVKLKRAFLQFGLHTSDLTEKNFLLDNAIDVFSYGIPPVSIDLMKEVKGLDFKEAFKNAETFIEDDLQIRYINYQSLIIAKRSSGRHKDLDDIEKLQ
ncbi:nucleotidyltransferase [Ferruginibacter sp. HRS2-29]|uniref:nucleotidyltransferase n=1 Tax=Ferruginibacter sp. HRS2-29 TaxID=2487334 RepID=UPI0020CF0C29|nr:nucleotidyltransferase [Ferruginibacter sp. HRS2-29]MCP9750927.1 hypothetical protein [Ferruginibacter sp. HRS2-29]